MIPRILPVLDIRGGLAVHAVGGDRAHYRPLRSRLHPEPDPLGLALACRDRLGTTELYLADLDAIVGGPPARALYRATAEAGLSPWVDAGLRTGREAAPLVEAGVVAVVAGLETLAGPGALAEAIESVGPDRLVLSLDLRDGRPIVAPGAGWGADDPLGIAAEAVRLGLRRLLVLDLARVGRGEGIGHAGLLERLRRDHPAVELAAGGGVSGPADLAALGALGVSAVLVGSALHDGRIDPSPPRSRLNGSNPAGR